MIHAKFPARSGLVALFALTIAAPLAAQTATAPTIAPTSPAAPPPAAVALPRTVFLQNMDAEFRKRDTNNDGKISRAELEAYERLLLIQAAQASNRVVFQKLDTNRDGVLSPGEFAALVQVPAVPDVTNQMSRFDTNRDQVITLPEFRGATLSNFDRLDTDKDGVISPAEMAAGNVPQPPR